VGGRVKGKGGGGLRGGGCGGVEAGEGPFFYISFEKKSVFFAPKLLIFLRISTFVAFPGKKLLSFFRIFFRETLVRRGQVGSERAILGGGLACSITCYIISCLKVIYIIYNNLHQGL